METVDIIYISSPPEKLRSGRCRRIAAQLCSGAAGVWVRITGAVDAATLKAVMAALTDGSLR